MSKLKKLSIFIFILGVVTLGFSASASYGVGTSTTPISSASLAIPIAPDSEAVTTPTTKNANGDNEVTDANLLLEYGPQGGLITILIGGILMISKAYKESKAIDVESYKAKAEEAKATADREIAKYRTQSEVLEAKNSALSIGADTLREALETRKAQFTADLMAAEARHREQIEELHHNLMNEITKRHRMEQILAINGLLTPQEIREENAKE